VPGISKIYHYSSISSLESLHRAVNTCRPDVLVPCDDGAASQCRALYEVDPTLRGLIECSLGPASNYHVLDSRFEFLNVAQECGIKVPMTSKILGAQDLVEWFRLRGGKSVVKIDGESGGNGVRICDTLSEAVAAWTSLRVVPSRAAAIKRIIIDRDPLSLWSRRQPREATVQEYISGRPANAMVLCWEGRVLALVSVAVVAATGLTGAATIVRIIDDEQIRHAAQVIAARLKLSGFCGLDFVIHSEDETPYLIEMNPRCTQLGHLKMAGGVSLASKYAAALRGDFNHSMQTLRGPERVAFFPQASAAGPACQPYIDTSYHDIPQGAPDLSRELLNGPWPQRQLVAMIYHAFKRIEPAAPTIYEQVQSPRAGFEPRRNAEAFGGP
jgi:hypothetical protein